LTNSAVHPGAIDTNSPMNTIVSCTPEVRPIPNSGWFHYPLASDTVFIFVHGFLSSSQTCWTSEQGVFWPQLVANDPRLSDVSVFLGGYYTEVDSQDYGVADCSEEVYTALSLPQHDGKRSPLDFRNVIFVCHSLGGIVVRYLCDTHRDSLANKSIGLLLVASPSLGSTYADTFSVFSRIMRNRAGRQLQRTGELINDLDTRFKSFIEENKLFKLVGSEAVETQGFLHTKFFRMLSPVVKWESAARYFGSPKKIPKTNHSTIAKPNGIEHPSHRHLINFFTKKFSTIRLATEKTINELVATSVEKSLYRKGSSLESQVLFDVYDKACDEYYFLRAVDTEIKGLLEHYSVWISGPSGAGKTSLVKRLVTELNAKPIEISLATYMDNLNGEACLREISETCLQLGVGHEVKTSSPLLWLTSALVEYSKTSTVILYIDEVPLGTKVENERSFVEFISLLLRDVKQKASSGTKFIISSLKQPEIGWNHKLSEQMVVRKIENWAPFELIGLYELILQHIPTLRLNADTLDAVIVQSDGSPRFLKTYLRNRHIAESSISDAEVLENTVHQLNGFTKK
jgi:pimeloyl-ACP methyl ester carboxylesterase